MVYAFEYGSNKFVINLLAFVLLFSFTLSKLLTWRVHIGVSIGDFQSSHMRSNRIHATRMIVLI